MTVRDSSTSVVKITRLAIGASKEEIKEWLEDNGAACREVRLCSHGRSAYAVLKNADEASVAMQIRKPMRGHRASVYPSSKVEMEETLTPHDNCVHLSGLPFRVTKADIREFFSPLALGENGIFLCLDRKGRQQGHGYVQFVDEETAKKALYKHEQVLLDRIISVNRTNLKLMQLAQEKSFSQLFHRGGGKPGSKEVVEEFPIEGAMVKLVDLPFGVTEDKIKQWFKEEDVVVQKVFLPDKQKKSKKVRAFVRLDTLDDLKKALQKDRRFMEEDIMMYNVPAWKVKQTLQILDFEDKVIHVKKLPSTYSEADIKELFKGSQIASKGVFLYSLPKRKGLLGAYVQFTDAASAKRAVRKNDALVDGKKIIVTRSSLEKRDIAKNIDATGKFKEVAKTNEKREVLTKKKKQKKRKSKKSLPQTVPESTGASKDLDADEEEITLKKSAPAEARLSLASDPAVERLQSENRQRRSSLKRKSILKDTNVEPAMSLPSKKTVDSPRKKRRSSMRFAETPKLR